ncbi:MAG: hypothetical protein JWO38_1045, partial [Gemmataceae bacterium]|nr:hypothetical protein [Gemmataceae bacterium]
FDRAAREAERMPGLKARAVEARVSQLEAAMAGGHTLRANTLANQLKGSLPPNMRREFEREWEQAKKEERWNKRQENPGLFGGGRREVDNPNPRPLLGGRDRDNRPGMDNPGGRQPIFGGGGGGGRPGRPGRP